MKTIRIGVLGGRRGRSMIRFCRESEYTQLAAVCDKDERILRSLQEGMGEEVPCLSSFEAFLEQDMDAVAPALQAFCGLFGLQQASLYASPFHVLQPNGANPYRQLYTPL